MKKTISFLIAIVLVFGLSGCSTKSKNKTSKSSDPYQYSTVQLHDFAQKIYDNATSAGLAFERDQGTNSYSFDNAEGTNQPTIKETLSKLKKNQSNPKLTKKVIRLGKDANGFIIELENLDTNAAKSKMDDMHSDIIKIEKDTDVIDKTNAAKMENGWKPSLQRMAESDSKQYESDNNSDGEDSSSSSVKSSSWSNPRQDSSSSSQSNSVSSETPSSTSATNDDKAALKAAQFYSSSSHMSQAGLYQQLTSDAGDKFTPEAAQYAIDNLHANWDDNALQSAKEYQSMGDMSTAEIHDQLTSQAGEQFTQEQADYAIAHLNQ